MDLKTFFMYRSGDKGVIEIPPIDENTVKDMTDDQLVGRMGYEIAGLFTAERHLTFHIAAINHHNSQRTGDVPVTVEEFGRQSHFYQAKMGLFTQRMIQKRHQNALQMVMAEIMERADV